jgi:general secretion pathway protein K
MSGRASRPPRALARARRRRRERGVALIMVLGAIAVMVVMLAEFQDDAGAEFAAATAARDSVQAEYFARSAVNLSRLLVAAEPTMRQGFLTSPLGMILSTMKMAPKQIPVWEFADRILGAFNDQESSQDFAGFSGLDLSLGKNLGLKGGRFEVQIVDEDSKININQAAAGSEITRQRLGQQIMGLMQPIQYDPLFEQRDATGNYHDRATICSAIVDWADADEQLFSCQLNYAPSSNAAEDAWYQLLPKPYRRKNAPYDSLEELHMVRGISDDFWTTFVDPEPTDPKKRLVTVWGSGKVNINSAAPATDLAIACSDPGALEFCNDPMQRQTFLTVMLMAKGLIGGIPLFLSPNDFINTLKGQGMLGPMLTAMGVKPVTFKAPNDVAGSLTLESKVFSVYAVGVVKGYKRETRVKIHAVVDFRTAPSLSGSSGAQGNTQTSGTQTSGTSSGQQVAVGGGSVDPNAILGAIQPSVGGQVLYYSIE